MTDQSPESNEADERTDRQLLHAILDRLDSMDGRLDGMDGRIERIEAAQFRTGEDLITIKDAQGRFEANQERDHQLLMTLVRKDEDASGTEE